MGKVLRAHLEATHARMPLSVKVELPFHLNERGVGGKLRAPQSGTGVIPRTIRLVRCR